MRYYLISAIFLFLLMSIGFQTLFSGSTDSGPENIVYLSVDALSAEHMECYGYHRETAPNICGLENSTKYKNAYTTSHWTPVALTSMQRGVYAHRANLVNDDTPISPNYPSIAEIASNEEYHTVIESNHGYVNEELNLDRGYEETTLLANDSEMGSLPYNFGERLSQEKMFYRLHITGPHDPYDPSWSYYNHTDYRYIDEVNDTLSLLPRERRSAALNKNSNIANEQRVEIIDHYDENILAADNYIGNFIEQLKENNQYEESLIIITADHGESFNNYGEDNWLHMTPNPPVARVPMLVKYPNSTEEEVDSSLVSVMDPFQIILNEIDADLDVDLDALDPREDERQFHYTYTKASGFSVTNKTNMALKRHYRRGEWSYFSKDNMGEMIRTDDELHSLKMLAKEFHGDVRSQGYNETVDMREDERIEERLVELGYID